MGKQVRLPEEFVQELRENFDGKNDYQRLKNWKSEGTRRKLVELLNKIEEIDVNNLSTNNAECWSRKEISDIAEDVVYGVMK